MNNENSLPLKLHCFFLAFLVSFSCVHVFTLNNLIREIKKERKYVFFFYSPYAAGTFPLAAIYFLQS